ncbi:MAG TPA: histidine phosphatase family protein [Anaerolineales bacterium]|nr:histidine phosphatase family protein [Anaerolineales bacterium]
MTENTLFLVRHGENRANLTLEFSSRRVDYSLTPKGVLQAQQTAEYFAGLQAGGRVFHAIYSSPLKRAAETAGYIAAALGLPVQILDQLREVDVGDLELAPPSREAWDYHNSLIRGWLDGQPEARFPGGDNFHDLVERALDAYRLALHGRQGENIILVAHGGIFAFTLYKLVAGLQPDWFLGKHSHNCSVSEIEAQLVDGRPVGRLKRWADHAHLSGEAANFAAGLPDARTFQDQATSEKQD